MGDEAENAVTPYDATSGLCAKHGKVITRFCKDDSSPLCDKCTRHGTHELVDIQEARAYSNHAKLERMELLGRMFRSQSDAIQGFNFTYIVYNYRYYQTHSHVFPSIVC